MQVQNIKKPKYKYEAPIEIFQQMQKQYLSKNKKSMLFEPIVLESIYKELQENEIYLTSFISQGSFGAVFEALYQKELVAVKCMNVDLDKIQEEQKIIGLLKDTPYVFKQIKEIKSSDESKYFQISKKYQCSLQDIMEDLFRKKKTLPLNQIIGFALQMSCVFEKMQTNKMLHSDIKPENILYDSLEKSFNLCDFGLSKFLKEGQSKTYQLKGATKKYSAREVLFDEDDNNTFNIKFDIYGLGIILLEMTLGRFLKNEECMSIVNGQLFNLMSKNQLYSDLNAVIIQMLQTKSMNRIDSFRLTELLNQLKLKIEKQFIAAVEGKLEYSESIQMISKFKQSYVQFNYEYKPKETRLDSYQFKDRQELEECILKRLVRNLDLNFQYNRLGADGAKNIGMSLEKCQNLTSLDLNLLDNRLGADGAKNIGMSLEKCQNLTSLDLNLEQNHLGEQDKNMIEEIQKKLKKLEYFNYEI